MNKYLNTFVLFLITIFSLFANSANASFINLTSTVKINVNAWDIVVDSNTIYVPSLNVKETGFEDASYVLSLKWTKDNTGRWTLIEAKKNSNQINPSSLNFKTDLLFSSISGYYESGKECSYSTGTAETVYKVEKEVPYYDGYGRIKYTQDVTKEVLVTPVYLRLTKKLLLTHFTRYDDYYFPALREFAEGTGETFCYTYEYAKNSAGVWKRKRTSQYSEWETVGENEAALVEKVKSSLGI